MAKATASGKSHGMRAFCKLSGMKASVHHKKTQLFVGFLARIELLALAGVESLVLVGQKETVVFCTFTGFLLSVCRSSPLSSSFFISSLDIGF